MNDDQSNQIPSSDALGSTQPQVDLPQISGGQQGGSDFSSIPASPVSSSLSDSPQAAEDADLIEKEWVLKAKDIVSRTKNDPRQQSDSMNLFKSDYLMKRYNKDLKSEESK